MNGIALELQEDGKLGIRCLNHNQLHIGADLFCCHSVMIRAISLGIRETPDGYHARAMGLPKQKSQFTELLMDIGIEPWAGQSLLFNPDKKGGTPIDN